MKKLKWKRAELCLCHLQTDRSVWGTFKSKDHVETFYVFILDSFFTIFTFSLRFMFSNVFITLHETVSKNIQP